MNSPKYFNKLLYEHKIIKEKEITLLLFLSFEYNLPLEYISL